MQFDASASTGATTYLWDFGDGATGTGMKVSHIYQQAGTYSVKLEVSKSDPSCSFGLCVSSTQKTVTVTGGGGGGGGPTGNGCSGEAADDPEKLCLLGGRFQVSVDFQDPKKGLRHAESIFSSNKTGFFWFFRPTNVELIVKILDGRTVDGNFWVFYGSLTNVHYDITVTDLETDEPRCSPRSSASRAALRRPAHRRLPGSRDDRRQPVGGWQGRPRLRPGRSGGGSGGSEPSDTLSLLDGRFKVSVDYSFTKDGGQTLSGQGTAVAGTDQSGYFWFFNQDNLELVVKMVDAREPFGHFWVFYGGLTSVGLHADAWRTRSPTPRRPTPRSRAKSAAVPIRRPSRKRSRFEPPRDSTAAGASAPAAVFFLPDPGREIRTVRGTVRCSEWRRRRSRRAG